MAGIFLRHDQDVPQAHLVDSIHPMGAQGVEGGEAMTADEIHSERQIAEYSIANAVKAALSKFHDRTGFLIDDVSVYLVHVETIGRETNKYIVRNVACRVSI